MKKIGIIGGLTSQASADFYNKLIIKVQKEYDGKYPNILINSVDTWFVVENLTNKQIILPFLIDEIQKIEPHVDYIGIVCNTMHYLIDELRTIISKPIIAIHEELVKEVKKEKIKKLGLLSTKATIQSGFYQKELDKNGIAYQIPSEAEIDYLDNLIFNSIVKGTDYDKASDILALYISHLKEKGCDGIALACTELPLFITQEEVDISLFPSTYILLDSLLALTYQ